MAPSVDTAPRLAYRPDLDGLRAIAVGLVILSHARLAVFANGGDVGVTVFFVLSGWLITILLLAEREQTGRIDLPAFYGRRVRRLGPALLLLLIVVFALDVVGGWPTIALSIGSTLFYVSNWVQATGTSVGFLGHTWSLSIEEQFYLVWPSVLIVLGARRAGVIAAALVILITIVRIPADGPFEYFSTFTRGDAVLVGCALAVARVRLPAWTAIIGIGSILVLACVSLPHDIGIPLVILAAAAVVCSGWRPLGRLAPMGKRAYGLYLWNWPLAILFGPLAIPLTFVAAETSWRLVELPINRRRRAPSTETPVTDMVIQPATGSPV
jgi:peptidoglycan/LPS O-acetylase OafA/YrhL